MMKENDTTGSTSALEEALPRSFSMGKRRKDANHRAVQGNLV